MKSSIKTIFYTVYLICLQKWNVAMLLFPLTHNVGFDTIDVSSVIRKVLINLCCYHVVIVVCDELVIHIIITLLITYSHHFSSTRNISITSCLTC